MSNTKKHILHFSETSEPGGSETVLAYIAQNLDSEKYNSSVCLIEDGWLCGQLDNLGIDYKIIENKKSYDLTFLIQLVKYISKRKIDLIHAHEFMTTFYGAIAAKIMRIPIIGTVHGKGYFTEKKSRRLAYKFAIKLSSKMVTVSRDLQRYMIDELNLPDNDKIVTIHNGIDLNKYKISNDSKLRGALKLNNNAIIGGIVGSLFKVKGLPYLIEAVNKVIKHHPEFILLIAGLGDQEESLRQQIDTMGLQKNVVLLGFRDDIPSLLNLFDVYLCSSISEGLSLSILEAMASGLPVVATDVGGNSELIKDNVNGFLVPPCDPHQLAKKIIVLLENRKLREDMGKVGVEIAEKMFSLKSMIDSYQNLYTKFIR